MAGLHERLDVRTICLAREILAFRDGLADFAMAMQGLGTGSVSLYGTPELKAALPSLRARRQGDCRLRAVPSRRPAPTSPQWPRPPFRMATPMCASTAPRPGSPTAASRITTSCSPAPARAVGAKGLSAFMVDADTPGLSIAGRIDVIAPHPLATLRFDACRVPVSNRLGQAGEGFKVAMATLDVFRSTVGAAALGFAAARCTRWSEHAATRKLFGAPLGELQLTQAAIADSATEVDAAALLVYRRRWTKDKGAAVSPARPRWRKMFATEAAQQVIDRAVQLHGGRGVTKGEKVEELYREIRALRIYEGATEVQKVVIAREALRNRTAKPARGR
jgi:acyl-CoA dehydrogenase